MEVSGQHHAPVALYPRGKNPYHCTGGWVSLKAGLDTEARGKISCPTRDWTSVVRSPGRPVRS